MKAVDPHIELITELNHVGHKLDPDLNERILEDRSLDKAGWFVRHTYAPWAIRKVIRQGEEVPAASLTDEQIWNAWVATPEIDPLTGQASLGWATEFRSRGRRMAVTEWNWNGWWSLPKDDRPAFNSDLAKGVGAAGWLHAFMRLGDEIRLACQSMTVGARWGITGIRVDPSRQSKPYPLPTGQVTGLYSRYHGSVRFRLEHDGVPFYNQPLRMAGIAPAQKVLALDLVATANKQNVYLHVINRSFGRDLPVTVNLSCFDNLTGKATLHALTGRVRNKPTEGEPQQVAEVKLTPLSFSGSSLEVTIPKRSVSVLVIPRITSD
jgi:alpha-L-arabinofuranosidase